MCSGDANQRLILVQKNGREDKNGLPEEFETVEVEELKQKEQRANPGHPATDAQIPERGGGVLISNNRLNQQMLRPSCEFAADKLPPTPHPPHPGGLGWDSPPDLPEPLPGFILENRPLRGRGGVIWVIVA